jgi:hypothetical protein
MVAAMLHSEKHVQRILQNRPADKNPLPDRACPTARTQLKVWVPGKVAWGFTIFTDPKNYDWNRVGVADREL